MLSLLLSLMIHLHVLQNEDIEDNSNSAHSSISVKRSMTLTPLLQDLRARQQTDNLETLQD